jgi:hypothetical protein
MGAGPSRRDGGDFSIGVDGYEPTDDDRFIVVIAHELEHLGGHSPEAAESVARKLLKASRESCCQTFGSMTLASRCAFLTMAGH